MCEALRASEERAARAIHARARCDARAVARGQSSYRPARGSSPASTYACTVRSTTGTRPTRANSLLESPKRVDIPEARTIPATERTTDVSLT